jgi:hypothetical protein
LKTSTQRRFVLALAGSLALLLGLGVVWRWRDLAREFHLWTLRRSPGRFEEMLLAGGAEEEAARSFVREPPGRQALFETCIAEFDRNTTGLENRKFLRRLEGGDVTHGHLVLRADGLACQTMRGSGGHSTFSFGDPPSDPKRRKLILELMDACVGETFRIADLKHLEFKVQPVRDGKLVPPRWPGGPTYGPGWLAWPAPGVRHACFFRVLPP